MSLNQNHAPLYIQQNVTSIHGRRLGLSIENAIAGPIGLKLGVTEIDSTVPSTLVPSHGVIRVSGLASSQGPVQHTLDNPIPGIPVTIVLACTSTGSQQFKMPSGASVIAGTLGTTAAVVNMIGGGGSITLVGVSSAQFMVQGSPTAVSFTTST